MKYVVTVNSERLELSRDGGDVIIDGTRTAASLEEIEGTPVRLVTIGDEVHRVILRQSRGRGSYVLWMDGYRYDVEALDERSSAIRDRAAASAVAAGPTPLIAPMPGLIIKIRVAVGDVVQQGQGLVVMEAMKMENELRASAAGTVKAIGAEAGTAVEKGTLLVELE